MLATARMMLMILAGQAGKDVGSNPKQIKLFITINHCHNPLNASFFLELLPHKDKALFTEELWTVT
jgi:hypothetical protein